MTAITRSMLTALVVVGAGTSIPALATTATQPLASPSAGRVAQPLPVRNLTPVTLLYGLPVAQGRLSGMGQTEVSLRAAHVNNFTSGAAAGANAASFDGSTTVATAVARRGWGRNFEWGVALPYVHHSGGFTDGFIDEFHDLFGFPDGGRGAVPRNRLDYRLVRGGVTRVEIDAATGDLGDVRGWLGYRIHDGPGRQGVLRAMIKAPTGGVADLTGSGGTDVALTFELTDHRTLEGAGIAMTLMGGITALGGDELPGTPQQDLVWSGHLGLHYPLTGNLTLRAQLDGHSDVIDGGPRQFGGATVQGTLGGTLSFAPGYWLDVGVVEDVAGAGAPDVVFLLRLGAVL